MNEAEAIAITEQLSVMKFFPSDPGARAAVIRLLQRMCANYETGQWLADAAVDVFGEWLGPRELRALYCSRFRPMDGMNAYSKKIAGFAARKEIAPSSPVALIDGAVASNDPVADVAVKIAVEVMRLKNLPFNAPVSKAELAAAPEWLKRLEGFDE